MKLAKYLYLAFLVPFLWACTTLSVEEGMAHLFPKPDESTYTYEEWDKLGEKYALEYGHDQYVVFQKEECEGSVWWIVGGRLRNWVWGDYDLEAKPWHWMEISDYSELAAVMDKGPRGWLVAKDFTLFIIQDVCAKPAEDKIKRNGGKINI